jgi:hypothetical protein
MCLQEITGVPFNSDLGWRLVEQIDKEMEELAGRV